MYNNGTIGVGGFVTGATLAATGLSILWAVLATFAVIAVGAAIVRIVPRKEK